MAAGPRARPSRTDRILGPRWFVGRSTDNTRTGPGALSAGPPARPSRTDRINHHRPVSGAAPGPAPGPRAGECPNDISGAPGPARPATQCTNRQSGPVPSPTQLNSAGLARTMYSFYKSYILKKKNGRTSPDNALFLVCNNYNIILNAILSAVSALPESYYNLRYFRYFQKFKRRF